MLFNKINELVTATIEKIPGITKPKAKFFNHLMILFLGMRGRYNFINLSRYGKLSEKTYRNQFERDFPFSQINKELIQSTGSEELISVFDPTFIKKSGKHTPHVGFHWSSVSGKAMRGLEFGCLGVVDVRHRTAFSLACEQTPSTAIKQKEEETLIDHYLKVVLSHRDELAELGIKHHVVDGYFGKEKYVSGILELIDRRRLRYSFDAGECCCFSGEVYSVGLKRLIRVVYIEQYDNQDLACGYTILFSTDLNLAPEKIYEYYTLRFQIEFLFYGKYIVMQSWQSKETAVA